MWRLSSHFERSKKVLDKKEKLEGVAAVERVAGGLKGVSGV